MVRIMFDSAEFTVGEFERFRSDRVANELCGEESFANDLYIMRYNSTSPLRLERGSKISVPVGDVMRANRVGGWL
jgi:hypothetical protein